MMINRALTSAAMVITLLTASSGFADDVVEEKPQEDVSPSTQVAQPASTADNARLVGQVNSRPASQFQITDQGPLDNAYAGIAAGFGLPGLVAFQANFAMFGGVAPGLYTDLRITGTVAGKEAFGTGSPEWANSAEVDLRVGYGTRSVSNNRGVLRDDDGRKIRARLPSAFGVTPYLGWRGRWGYNTQQIRLGIHVASNTDLDVMFSDGRHGRSFKHWAFDAELSYSGGWQKGLGGQLGSDYWFNNFLYLRTELGFAQANKEKFAPHMINDFTGSTEVKGVEGFWMKAMIGFAFQFHIKDVTEKEATPRLTASQVVVDERTHEDKIDTPKASDQDDKKTAAAVKEEKDVAPAASNEAKCDTDADCSDGIFCNGEEQCISGVCKAGTLPDDGISCTQLVCDENKKEFRFEPLNGLCGDGIFCNGVEICDPEVGCIAGDPVPVEDGNPCTHNYCDESQRRIITDPIPNCFTSDED